MSLSTVGAGPARLGVGFVGRAATPEEIMPRVQFRLRGLLIAIVIVALLLAVGIQTVRIQRLQAQAERALAAEMEARRLAERARQQAARSA